MVREITMKHKNIVRGLVAVAVVLALGSLAQDALAQKFTSSGVGGTGGTGAGTLFSNAETLADNTVGRSQQVVYGLGGLGAIGLGALAFMGRFQWSWFFGLVGGLVLIAGLQTGIEYFTGDSQVLQTTKSSGGAASGETKTETK
jgi:hypothetical protein